MHSDKCLIEARELTFGKRGAIPNMLARLAMGVLGLNRANRVYAETYHHGADYAASLLKRLGIGYHIDSEDLDNIPAEGSAIVICNHPTGAMDGIAMIDLLTSVRPDVKFMGNFLLDRIEPLRRYNIAVDPFDTKSRTLNMRGIKESIDHLRGGGLLMMFPAGEVSTWQKGFSQIKDRQWDPSVVKFIRRAEVPVVPMYIEARNSHFFRLVGKINPMFRTALLPHELFNKKGGVFRIIAGTAIAPKRLTELDEVTYAGFLRASVDYLKGSRGRGENAPRSAEADSAKLYEGIIERPPLEGMLAELEAIKEEYKLFDYGETTLYCVPTPLIPNIMQEIGRLREITFRGIGEGSMKSVDVDGYDEYYHQMFLWDGAERQMMGGYRIGFGDEIMEKYGMNGFYTDSLFGYSHQIEPVLAKTIELGRSFIAREYQKRPTSLMLLWKGIVYVLLKHGQFRNMLGPVTISGEFHSSSKLIITTYLKQQHCNDKLAQYVHPVAGLKGIKSDVDLSLIAGIESVDLINKLVLDIEQEQRGVPVLVKKYLGLSSTVLGFNVDPDFRDALDALMLLDMKHVPADSIAMLSKEITDIDVVARFRDYTN